MAFSGYGGSMPQVDFSTLGDLGNTYQQARIQGGRQRALEGLQQGAPLNDIARALFQAGDVEGGRSLAQLAMAGAQQAETARHNQASENLTRESWDKPFHEKVDEGLTGSAIVQVDPRKGTSRTVYSSNSPPPTAAPVAASPNAPAVGSTSPIVPKQVQTESVTPSPAGAVPQPATSAAPGPGERNHAFLQSLPANDQALIKGLADYDINPSTLRRQQVAKIIEAVKQYDPTYDQKNYTTYQVGLKAFGTGTQGNAVRAFNVGTEHLDQLGELGKALDNGDIQKVNAIRNWWKTNTGQDAPTNFNGLKAIVGAEIVKAIVGAGGTGEERAQAARTVADASSPTQLFGIMQTYKGAMAAQLSGLRRQYEQSTGRKDFTRLLSPAAQAHLEQHDTGQGAGSNGPVKVNSPDEARKLTPGTRFITPDGREFTR